MTQCEMNDRCDVICDCHGQIEKCGDYTLHALMSEDSRTKYIPETDEERNARLVKEYREVVESLEMM